MTCSAVLTFEFVDEILWCDHSNETSLAELLHGTTCFSILYKTKFVFQYFTKQNLGFSLFLFLALFRVKGLNIALPFVLEELNSQVR